MQWPPDPQNHRDPAGIPLWAATYQWVGVARSITLILSLLWGRSLRNVPRRLQTLEGSFSDEGGGEIHGHSTIGVRLASRPCAPYPMAP
eukprot:1213944-Pyramimonas_sp.AAC.1